MIAIRTTLRRLLADYGGATAIEYGLIVGLIAVAIITGLGTLAGGSGSLWGKVETNVTDAMT